MTVDFNANATRRTALVALFGLALLACLPSVRAETTQEMIKRLAEQGRNENPWVAPTACQAQQDALRKIQPNAVPALMAEQIAELLRSPWVYRYSGKVTGTEMPVEELREKARFYDAESLGAERRFQQAPNELYRKNQAREYELQACAYRVAADTKAGPVPDSNAGTRPTVSTTCAPAAAARVNRGLAPIAKQFLDYQASAAARNTAGTAPGFQLVMWQTSEAAKVVDGHCPDADDARQYVKSLEASYNKARQACLKIQSSEEACVPVSPLVLLARYEKSQRAAPAEPATTASSYPCFIDPKADYYRKGIRGAPADIVAVDVVNGGYLCEAGADAREAARLARPKPGASTSTGSHETSQGLRK